MSTAAPGWTRPQDLRAQLQKRWDKGALLGTLLAERAGSDRCFPLRLRLVVPTSAEWADRFDEVRRWAADLHQLGGQCRVVERELRHRVIGNHQVPDAVWVDTLAQAAAWLGRGADVRRLADVVTSTRHSQPALLPWLAKRPLVALALAPAWARLLAVVGWVQAHPRPGIYLRQVDLPGVDSKFIETHRGVLTELLDLALPAHAIDPSATGQAQFARRYGFADKPLRIRLRWLGGEKEGEGEGEKHGQGEWGRVWGDDIALTQTAFNRLALPVRHVFITENEVNFLAFPRVPHSLVLFGAGYGFDALASAAWLHRCRVHHWGDIDTHGFAILDQLRHHLPHAQSLLMDMPTLLAHQAHWGGEPKPLLRDLPLLSTAEAEVFDGLRAHRWAPRLRLEQEHIGFDWLCRAVADVLADGAVRGV